MKVKICGITHPDDAAMAARLGADYIGIVFAPQSKRYVSVPLAKEIAAAARQEGSEPVAIGLTEEESREIGIYSFQTKSHLHIRGECFPFFDGPKPGSGISFDWKQLNIPDQPWALAGGLDPKNIQEAIQLLHPSIVDVSSGVEREGKKDATLIEAFIQAAKGDVFGGQYLPEILVAPAQHLAKMWNQAKEELQEELEELFTHYAGRPTPLTEVKNFSAAVNAPRIFLKREDLLHTGAHKINNALGQCLLAKKLGKNRIIAETGAGQHGVATATACARLGLKCVIYMGSTDIERQRPNVDKMELLGATVVSVTTGSCTLKDAINEALRDWSANYETSHYCLGSALGSHPYPEIVRSFQSVISRELKQQIKPDLLIACVGGGSNAIGFFHHFIADPTVKLVGVEAEGAARFTSGKPGVLHGCYTYLLQNEEGQVLPTHSISAGLDYPAVGPSHAKLFSSGRATFTTIHDDEAIEAFYLLTVLKGSFQHWNRAMPLLMQQKLAQVLIRTRSL